MALIEWSAPALQDLQAAGDFVAKENPDAAGRMAARVREAAEYLSEHPNIGRPGRLAETRELVVSGSAIIIVYWLREGRIQILRMLHHARRWP